MKIEAKKVYIYLGIGNLGLLIFFQQIQECGFGVQTVYNSLQFQTSRLIFPSVMFCRKRGNPRVFTVRRAVIPKKSSLLLFSLE